jgi:hypothetical protein
VYNNVRSVTLLIQRARAPLRASFPIPSKKEKKKEKKNNSPNTREVTGILEWFFLPLLRPGMRENT